ncbi:hypothetical protein [Spirosoma pollinicola]|nr:hypothetical protein [Spirosoma pollinicola]
MIFSSFLSCTKDVAPQTPEQLLTAHAWKIDEIRYLQNNTPHYYKRGGTQNTESFSDEYIEFFSDKTGKYYAQDQSSASLTWGFANAEKTILQYTLQSSLPITWENLILTKGSIRYTEYYDRYGTKSLAEAIRIPK